MWESCTCMSATHVPPAWVLHTCHVHECYTRATCMSATHVPPAWVLHTCHVHECCTRATCMSAAHVPRAWVLHTCHLHEGYTRATCMSAAHLPPAWVHQFRVTNWLITQGMSNVPMINDLITLRFICWVIPGLMWTKYASGAVNFNKNLWFRQPCVWSQLHVKHVKINISVVIILI